MITNKFDNEFQIKKAPTYLMNLTKKISSFQRFVLWQTLNLNPGFLHNNKLQDFKNTLFPKVEHN